MQVNVASSIMHASLKATTRCHPVAAEEVRKQTWKRNLLIWRMKMPEKDDLIDITLTRGAWERLLAALEQQDSPVIWHIYDLIQQELANHA